MKGHTRKDFSRFRFGSRTQVAPRKRRIQTHLPKDTNCEICKRTKITRVLCRKRTDDAVPRIENFGDLITADHEVLNEDGDSRNNQRHAVVGQDLATQRIQSYPCKTNTSQETQRSSRKFLEPSEKLKVICVRNPLELAKPVKTHRGISVHQRHIDPRQMASERAVRRMKEGTSSMLFQSCLDENQKSGVALTSPAKDLAGMSRDCGSLRCQRADTRQRMSENSAARDALQQKIMDTARQWKRADSPRTLGDQVFPRTRY